MGASRGIGAAVSRRLVAAGAFVHGVYRDNEDAAASVSRELGDRFRAARCDAAEPEAVDALFRSVAEHSQARIDVLVNCVGGPSDGLLLRADADAVEAALSLNFRSVVNASRAVLPTMLKRRYGRIVNVSSVVASLGNAGQSLYAASKSAVEGFTRSLAREVGRRSVTVNAVAPGYIETDMTAGLDRRLRDKVVEASAVGRVGSADEVAAAVEFLASEAASYVTGAILHVNGGVYM